MTRRLADLSPEQAERQRAATKRYKKQNDPEKARAQARVVRAKNPEKYREKFKRWYYANPSYHLKKTYGMTAEEHEALFVSQGSQCAGCQSQTPGKKSSWHTDHCHKTGKVRGILCHGCNISIGLTKDCPTRLRALADYVERNQ